MAVKFKELIEIVRREGERGGKIFLINLPVVHKSDAKQIEEIFLFHIFLMCEKSFAKVLDERNLRGIKWKIKSEGGGNLGNCFKNCEFSQTFHRKTLIKLFLKSFVKFYCFLNNVLFKFSTTVKFKLES